MVVEEVVATGEVGRQEEVEVGHLEAEVVLTIKITELPDFRLLITSRLDF